MQIRGATGEVKWSYLTAAIFGPWRLETTPDGATLDGTLVTFDAYRIKKEGLIVSVAVGRSRLLYPIRTVDIHADGTISAQLGPRIQQGVAREQSNKEEADMVR